MDVGAAGSQSLYAYQAASASGQNATLQALTQTYADTMSAASQVDPLTAVAGQGDLGSLVASIYTTSQAQDPSSGATSGIQGLQPSQVVGGLDAASASALLTSLSGNSPSSGLQGFSSALGSSSSLALAGAQAVQAYGSGGLTADAQAQAGATPAPTSTQAASAAQENNANATYAQQAIAASQQASLSNTFTLLA